MQWTVIPNPQNPSVPQGWIPLIETGYDKRAVEVLATKDASGNEFLGDIIFWNNPTHRAQIRNICIRTDSPLPPGMPRKEEYVLPEEMDESFWAPNPTPRAGQSDFFIPMNHQQIVISMACMHKHLGILLKMGLGKTYCATSTMKYWVMMWKRYGSDWLANTVYSEGQPRHPSPVLPVFMVICPKNVIATWEVEIEKFGRDSEGTQHLVPFIMPDKGMVQIDEKGKKKRRTGVESRADMIAAAIRIPGIVIITNYETFNHDKKDLWGHIFEQGYMFYAIFTDESTRIRNTETRRYKGAAAFIQLSHRRYTMSGFPSPQCPADYVGQSAFLHPIYLGYKSTGAYINENAIRGFGNKIEGWRNTDTLKKQLKNFCIAMDYGDTNVKLPDRIDKTLYVQMSEEQTAAYTHLMLTMNVLIEQSQLRMDSAEDCPTCENHRGYITYVHKCGSDWHGDDHSDCYECGGISEWLDTKECPTCHGYGKVLGPDLEVTIKHLLVFVLKLSQITGGWIGTDVGVNEKTGKAIIEHHQFKRNPKMETLVSLVNDEEDGESQIQFPFIVFARFKHELKEISRLLNVPVISGTGMDRHKLRDILLGLQSGKYRGVAIQPEAGGIGLNLQMCKTAIYYSNDFKLESRIQSEARLHRIGQLDPVTIIDLECMMGKQETVDRYIIQRLAEKKDIGMEILTFMGVKLDW